MTTRTMLRRTAAGIAVAGIATGATFLASGAATAEPVHTASSDLPCTAKQFTTRLIAGEPGAGQRYGYLELTGKRGQRCAVPGDLTVRLVGAHNVVLEDGASHNAPRIILANGSSAHAQLHWTGIEAAAQQQTPNALNIEAPSDTDTHGHYVNPNVDVQWTLGAVDASREAHTIDIGTVHLGKAPRD